MKEIEGADTETGFAARILKLCLSSETEWQRVSLANQQYVKQRFSKEVCLRFFYRILERA